MQPYMRAASLRNETAVAETLEELRVGDGLVVRMVDIGETREQDVNAQMMEPRHFERLIENIKERGQIESLPYLHRPNDDGPYHIISGHHRVRAARQAGVNIIPCLVDLTPMRRSQIVAKQIAHNELHGRPDTDILARLVAEIDDAADLLTTGLDPDMLPTVDMDAPSLENPHVDYDWRMVTLTFLPEQLAAFDEAARLIESKNELIGVAPLALFNDFATKLAEYGRTKNIRSMATVVSVLTDMAARELEAATQED
jgi:hypothetical protein